MGCTLNPILVPLQEEEPDGGRRPRREGAEVRVMHARTSQRPATTAGRCPSWRRQDGFSPVAFRGSVFLLDFRCIGSRTVKQQMSVGLSQPVCGILLGKLRKQIQPLQVELSL